MLLHDLLMTFYFYFRNDTKSSTALELILRQNVYPRVQKEFSVFLSLFLFKSSLKFPEFSACEHLASAFLNRLKSTFEALSWRPKNSKTHLNHALQSVQLNLIFIFDIANLIL